MSQFFIFSEPIEQMSSNSGTLKRERGALGDGDEILGDAPNSLAAIYRAMNPKTGKEMMMLNKHGKLVNRKTVSSSQKSSNARDKFTAEIGKQRFKASAAWNQLKNSFTLDTEARVAFEAWMTARPMNERHAFGADDEGIAHRKRIAMQGFTISGGVGKKSAYTITNGILRGGLTARGDSVGNGKFAIDEKIGTRQLSKLQAYYVDPMLLPATRVVKYIRGHWGVKTGDRTALLYL